MTQAMDTNNRQLTDALTNAFSVMDQALESHRAEPKAEEIGIVTYVSKSIVRVSGLPHVGVEELIRFPGDARGIVFDLASEEITAVLLDEQAKIEAGDEVRRTGQVISVPVGEALIGRVVDPLGRPLDGLGPITATDRRSIEQESPAIMDRSPVTVPLQTGIRAIDALIPIGRGQRELILGDRQTGKTAVALDTIINQKDSGVICIYCAIALETSVVVKVIEDLRTYKAMDYTIVMMAASENSAGMHYVAPYAATTMGEYFMEKGRDVLIVYDDLSRHARAYREISLLMRRPPAREAYPGDIFYIHSRLLERATHLREELGGGSLTALPIVETESQNLSAYIPTNLISITDGQIYLSPKLFQEGVLPAVDVGKSVSRVGGKAQLAAYRAVAGDLHLSYSQFEELETFSRFGTRLDENTRKTLEHGRCIREVLKQSRYQPLPVHEQIAVLLAATEGLLDGLSPGLIAEAKKAIERAATERLGDVNRRIRAGEKLTDEDRKAILDTAGEVIRSLTEQKSDVKP
ncbi:MAG: alternate F1F0 ATPase, F1 subunit alpha [Candidatus Latescibacter sp.]|nr:alternate F1F0 ATPase, F1 subunit alpha [Candidatus Latescibacter sp.]